MFYSEGVVIVLKATSIIGCPYVVVGTLRATVYVYHRVWIERGQGTEEGTLKGS